MSILQDSTTSLPIGWKGTSGAGHTTLATQIAGEDLAVDVLKTEMRFSPLNITTNATTVVKSGSGLFHALVINIVGTIAADSRATIYDNTAGSGTVIATVDLSNAALGPMRIYNATFSIGLTVVTAGTTAANITVMYR